MKKTDIIFCSVGHFEGQGEEFTVIAGILLRAIAQW